jgi:hypothetical protein
MLAKLKRHAGTGAVGRAGEPRVLGRSLVRNAGLEHQATRLDRHGAVAWVEPEAVPSSISSAALSSRSMLLLLKLRACSEADDKRRRLG